jgi:carbon storage regulator CsrA
MLVLTRKIGESITIGDVTVVVCRIAPGKVRLGIEAPRNIKITRGNNDSSTGTNAPRPRDDR